MLQIDYTILIGLALTMLVTGVVHWLVVYQLREWAPQAIRNVNRVSKGIYVIVLATFLVIFAFVGWHVRDAHNRAGQLTTELTVQEIEPASGENSPDAAKQELREEAAGSQNAKVRSLEDFRSDFFRKEGLDETQ